MRELTTYAALWFAFLLLCLGLGYPSVKRFDPQTVGGLNDVKAYGRIVEYGAEGVDVVSLHRSLIPEAARLIYLRVKGHSGSWNATSLSLLLVNAPLCATAAFFVFLSGARIRKKRAGVIAALL